MATPRLGLVVEDKPTELSYTCSMAIIYHIAGSIQFGNLATNDVLEIIGGFKFGSMVASNCMLSLPLPPPQLSV